MKAKQLIELIKREVFDGRGFNKQKACEFAEKHGLKFGFTSRKYASFRSGDVIETKKCIRIYGGGDVKGGFYIYPYIEISKK